MNGNNTPSGVLVLGYGNADRGDDGLGPACVARLEAAGLHGVTTRSAMQLVVEDAEAVTHFNTVVFVDAAEDAESSFYLRPVLAEPFGADLSHHVSPGQVIGLAELCFGARPEAFLLGIRAETFEPCATGLSSKGAVHLELAFEHLIEFLRLRD